MICIFMKVEGDKIKSKQVFKRYRTLWVTRRHIDFYHMYYVVCRRNFGLVDRTMNQSKKEQPVNITSELTLEGVKQLFLYVSRL